MRNKIEISKIEQFYDITSDGQVYSKIRKRWLKPQLNNCGYVFYCLQPYNKFIFAHTIVALKYIGLPPTEKHEINHKDGNRANNEVNNLEWVTKSENQLKAYAAGRDHYWKGKSRPSPALLTRMKMANAKKKRIRFIFQDQEHIYESIDDAASQLMTYRKRIYLSIKTSKPFKGGYLSVIND
jgi:hypothetical protein